VSHNINTSLVVVGNQGLPPFRALSNDGSDAFIINNSGYVYISNVDTSPVSPTYSFLVLGVDGKIESVSMFSTSTPAPDNSSGTSGLSGSAGTSGTSGIDGSSGTSGIDGSGSSGSSGTSGIDGSGS
jgi:hypothetical protein